MNFVVWDLKSGKRTLYWPHNGLFVHPIHFDNEKANLIVSNISGSLDFIEIHKTDQEKQSIIQTFVKARVDTGCSSVNALDTDENDQTYAVGCQNGMTRIWDSRTNRLKNVLINLPEAQWLLYDAQKSVVETSDKARDWVDVISQKPVERRYQKNDVLRHHTQKRIRND